MKHTIINTKDVAELFKVSDVEIELNEEDIIHFKERTGWTHTININKKIGTIHLTRKPY